MTTLIQPQDLQNPQKSPSPFLIFIEGPMGSGKTTTSKLLNQRLPDTARIAMPDIKRLIPNYKENKNTLVILRDVMNGMVDTYLKHNVSVIVELVTKADGVEILRETAKKYDARFFGYRLSAPKDIREKRVHDRTRETLGVETLTQEKIIELSEYFEPNDRFFIYNPISNGVLPIDTEKMSPEEVVEWIIKRID
jgi:broad-specificity NMP kinase